MLRITTAPPAALSEAAAKHQQFLNVLHRAINNAGEISSNDWKLLCDNRKLFIVPPSSPAQGTDPQQPTPAPSLPKNFVRLTEEHFRYLAHTLRTYLSRYAASMDPTSHSRNERRLLVQPTFYVAQILSSLHENQITTRLTATSAEVELIIALCRRIGAGATLPDQQQIQGEHMKSNSFEASMRHLLAALWFLLSAACPGDIGEALRYMKKEAFTFASHNVEMHRWYCTSCSMMLQFLLTQGQIANRVQLVSEFIVTRLASSSTAFAREAMMPPTSLTGGAPLKEVQQILLLQTDLSSVTRDLFFAVARVANSDKHLFRSLPRWEKLYGNVLPELRLSVANEVRRLMVDEANKGKGQNADVARISLLRFTALVAIGAGATTKQGRTPEVRQLLAAVLCQGMRDPSTIQLPLAFPIPGTVETIGALRAGMLLQSFSLFPAVGRVLIASLLGQGSAEAEDFSAMSANVIKAAVRGPLRSSTIMQEATEVRSANFQASIPEVAAIFGAVIMLLLPSRYPTKQPAIHQKRQLIASSNRKVFIAESLLHARKMKQIGTTLHSEPHRMRSFAMYGNAVFASFFSAVAALKSDSEDSMLDPIDAASAVELLAYTWPFAYLHRILQGSKLSKEQQRALMLLSADVSRLAARLMDDVSHDDAVSRSLLDVMWQETARLIPSERGGAPPAQQPRKKPDTLLPHKARIFAAALCSRAAAKRVPEALLLHRWAPIGLRIATSKSSTVINLTGQDAVLAAVTANKPSSLSILPSFIALGVPKSHTLGLDVEGDETKIKKDEEKRASTAKPLPYSPPEVLGKSAFATTQAPKPIPEAAMAPNLYLVKALARNLRPLLRSLEHHDDGAAATVGTAVVSDSLDGAAEGEKRAAAATEGDEVVSSTTMIKNEDGIDGAALCAWTADEIFATIKCLYQEKGPVKKDVAERRRLYAVALLTMMTSTHPKVLTHVCGLIEKMLLEVVEDGKEAAELMELAASIVKKDSGFSTKTELAEWLLGIQYKLQNRRRKRQEGTTGQEDAQGRPVLTISKL